MDYLVDPQDVPDVVAQHGPFLLTKTGVIEVHHPTYAQWEAAMQWCQDVEKAAAFWVGDLLLVGDQFGEKASQVLEPTAFALQTARNAKHVCKVIPPERRHPDVPFSHHQEVAALESPVEQDYWLAKCEAENLTRDELRVQIKTAKAQETGTKVVLWLTVSCTDLTDLQHLAERMQLEGRSVKQSAKELALA